MRREHVKESEPCHSKVVCVQSWPQLSPPGSFFFRPHQLCRCRILFCWRYHLSTAKCRDSERICEREEFPLLFVSHFKVQTPRNCGRAAVRVFNCISGLVKAQRAGGVFQGEAGSPSLPEASGSVTFFPKSDTSLPRRRSSDRLSHFLAHPFGRSVYLRQTYIFC